MTHLDDILDLSRQSERGPLSPWFDVRLREQEEAGLLLSPIDLERVGGRLIQPSVDYRNQAGVFTSAPGMSGGAGSIARSLRRC